MKHIYFNRFCLVIIIMVSWTISGQTADKLWTRIDALQAKNNTSLHRKIEPTKELFYQLNELNLRGLLATAGNRVTPGNTIISIPNSNGEMKRYRVYEASIMEPDLQNQFPEIKSYAGQGIDNPFETIRFSLTPKGFHAMVLGTTEGTQFIDPYTTTNQIYTVYSKGDLKERNFEWECGVIDDPLVDRAPELNALPKNANDGTLRNYRIAIACTGEYGAFHGTTVGEVMAAMNVTMTRVNGIYERDLSITMTMVDNTSVIFFDGATDPFDNNNAGLLINQSQTVIDANIGAFNYDIGHTFSTGGGGLAGVGVTCANGSKARGITGLPSPVGDVFDVDYVAHELGHQFGALHTFNGNGGPNCLNQRSASDAYEPGSGSTIMAYAGICPPQNVQNNSDDYFHQISLVRIFNHVLSTGACPANRTITGNSAPTANAGADYTIPRSTPYKLIGSSADPDGTGTHTYTWEQFDLGPQGPPAANSFTGPIVRSFEGTNNPVRYIPRLQDLKVIGGSTQWEILPTVGRNLNFSLTVRDNDSRGGQTTFDLMTANVATGAGPFVVTSQNTSGINWEEGTTQTITWDVAGTTANGVNEANVNILLSTDGETYDIVLASNVPNDGSHDITVPSGISSVSCRIMVEAANGIFFNINSEDITIGATLTCTTYSSNDVDGAIPDGGGNGGNPVAGTPFFDPITIPDDVVIESVSVSVDMTHPNLGDILIQLQHPDIVNDNSLFVNVYVGQCGSNDNMNITFEDGGAPINCATPTTGVANPFSPLSLFNGSSAQGAWNIALVDFFLFNTGTLNNWSIEICTTSSLSTDDNTLAGFTIYPNPNTGEFTVGFDSGSGEDIVLEVYDLRGRIIYKRQYNSVSRFEEVVRLKNAQSGVYVLTISDGTQKATHKIIVD
jgi:subtilisin-like proprotein convertase family protein